MSRSTVPSKIYSAMTKAMGKPAMRPVTKAFSSFHAAAFRLTKGAASNPKWPMLVLDVTGRKSGKSRGVPLVYVCDGDRYIVAAAYGGSAVDPAWWLNLQANPDATALVKTGRVRVRAAKASAEERARLWPRLVEMYPYFAEYQQRTTREIPVVVLTPCESKLGSDGQLAT